MEKKWGLIGIPDDIGDNYAGGRLGAAKGPDAFRLMFKKMRGKDGVHELLEDQDNVDITKLNIKENHKRAIQFIKQYQGDYPFTIIIGGSQDHTHSQLVGIKNSLKKKGSIGCINIGPHLEDKAPKMDMSSDTSYYQCIEEGIIDGENLVEFGIQPQCNPEVLWNYAKQKHIHIIQLNDIDTGHVLESFEKELKYLSKRCDHIVINLDMSAFPAPNAPGVSDPSVDGFTPNEVSRMLRLAASNKKVISLGIFELNPDFDIDNRTAKLAATCAYHFVAAKLNALGMKPRKLKKEALVL